MGKELRNHPVALRALEVSVVVDVSPRIRRVTLTGAELAGFERDGLSHAAFRSDGPDDHVKVFLAPDGDPDGPVKLPAQADGHLDWPEDHSITHRDYTVRRFDPDRAELDLEFVLHGHGPGARWAGAARVGHRLMVAGPRSSLVMDPVAQLVLAGDETALPAIARWLDEADASTAVTVVVEIDDPSHEVVLERPAGALDLRWIHRASGGSLLGGLAGLPALVEDSFVFVAGEFSMVAAARTHLKVERGLAPDRYRATSYWRSGQSALEEHLAEHRLAELSDLLTPNALRVAATLRLPDLVERGFTTAATLASEVDGDVVTIEALIHHLADRDVFTVSDDGVVGLGPLGRLLLDDHPSMARRRLDLHGAEGHMHAAWNGLLHTATTGRAGYEAVHDIGFWDQLKRDEDLARSFDGYLAVWAAVWVPPVVAGHQWSRYSHVVDLGGGMGILLAEILAAAPEASGTLVELAAPAATAAWWFAEKGLTARASAIEGDFFAELPSGDAIVLAQVLHDWPDEQAVAIASRASQALTPDGRVLVIERLSGNDGRRHADMTLLMRNLFAATERSEQELIDLMARAGLSHVETSAVGDTLHLLEFAGGDR